MKTNVYCIKDVVSGLSDGLWCSPTDSALVRSLLPALSSNDSKLNTIDYEVYCVGSFSAEDGRLSSCEPRLVAWDSYRAPIESPADKISVDDYKSTVEKISSNK